MELIENQRVVSKYSESISSKNRSLHNQTTIELGKKVTSPKKTTSHKFHSSNPPLKVIKINHNVKSTPHLPRYSYNTNNRIPKNYTSSPSARQQRNFNPQRSQNTYPLNSIKTQKKPRRFATNNIIKTQRGPPAYPPRNNITYKNPLPPNKLNRSPIKYDNKNTDIIGRRSHIQYPNSHTPNINYQYIPQLQNKYTGDTNPTETPYKPNKKHFKSPRKYHKPSPIQKKLKKPKRLYQKKRLYLKQERVPKPNKHSDKIPTTEKKYFNAKIFAKNKNQTEHFNKLSSEDIYICSVLSEDLNIIRKK